MREPQVSSEHYRTRSYLGKDRWISYWYQLSMVMECGPKRVLEIGPGNKTVTEFLKKQGIEVVTADIAADVKPDVVASVVSLPFPDTSFDCVLAAEVLEHIPYDDVALALSEIGRVSARYAVISLPHAGYVFSFGCKIPLLRRHDFLIKIPFFWHTHMFNGEHYWELGKRMFPIARVRKSFADAGFSIHKEQWFFDDPAHIFFILEKRAS